MKKRFSILFFSILFCLMFSTMAFAGSIATADPDMYPLPTIPEGNPYSEYIIVELGGTTKLYYFYDDESFTVNSTIDSAIRFVTNRTGITRHTFTFNKDTKTWGDSGSQTTTNKQNSFSFTYLYDCSVDILNSDGTVFFQAPLVNPELHQIIQRVTEQGLKEKLTLAGTIRILLLCGVGLMALLVVLSLFGKVFNRYRN